MRFATAALAAEAVLIAGIISFVPYTEIDWKAYMSEVSGFLDGELNYRQLKGDTGPLVYPGGFVWIYSVLYYFTKLGEDIRVAQWIFAGVYLFTLMLVLRFYTNAGLTWKVMLPLFISKRIRSLYVLRLFNDCWAMLFLMVALTLIAGVPLRHGRRARHWMLGCFFYSFAVSIKMNVLLFAPGMLYVMLRTQPLLKVVGCLCVCATWQLLAGLPFLLHDAEAYLSKGFELGRVFTQRWSVNYQFIDNELFVDPRFGMGLLAATVATWVLVWRTRWAKRTFLTSAEAEELRPVLRDVPHSNPATELTVGDDDEEDVLAAAEETEERAAFAATVLTFFESNLIGVVFARSLHYQFYTWFFFTIPFVLSFTTFPRLLRLVTFALIRQAFEQYPPSPRTSVLLQGGFALSLVAVLFLGRDDGPTAQPKKPLPPQRRDGTEPTQAKAGAASTPTAVSPTAADSSGKEEKKMKTASPPSQTPPKPNNDLESSPTPSAKPAGKTRSK
jgi:alpha-1,3-mannosyltransferase